ncbi:MAG: transposase [Minisyncoccia bacterium]|jgi:transposase-like protein
MVCVYCNSNEIVKNGKVRGVQRFLCKKCNKNFSIKNDNNNLNVNNNSNGTMDKTANNNISNVQGITNDGNNNNITLDKIISIINESIEKSNEINEDIKKDIEVKKVDENKIQLLKKVVELVYTFLLKLALKLVERYLNKRLRKDFDLNEFIKKAHSYVYEMLKEKGIIREDMEIDNTFLVIVIHLDLLLALEDIEDNKQVNDTKNEVKNETIIIPNQVQNIQSNPNINQINLNQYRSLDI